MGLPHIDIENITCRDHDTRAALVEINPENIASGHHGAVSPMRFPTACRSGMRSPAASAASASS